MHDLKTKYVKYDKTSCRPYKTPDKNSKFRSNGGLYRSIRGIQYDAMNKNTDLEVFLTE